MLDRPRDSVAARAYGEGSETGGISGSRVIFVEGQMLRQFFRFAVAIAFVTAVYGCAHTPKLPILNGERRIISNTLPLEEEWQFKTNGLVRKVQAIDKRVYIWHGSFLTAVDVDSGKRIWEIPASNDLNLITAIGDGAIAFSPSIGGDWTTSVVSADTGQLKWKELFDDLDSLAIGDGQLYLGTENVSAWNLETGQKNWQIEKKLPSHRVISVFFDGQRVVVLVDRQIYVLNPADGHITNSSEITLTSEQIISDDEIYSVRTGEYVAAINLLSGRVLWRNDLVPFGFRPVLLNNRLYIITGRLELVALDATTGKLVWKTDPAQQAFSNVVEFAGLGYVISDSGRLYGFDPASGETVGAIDTGVGLPLDVGHKFRPSLVTAGKVLIFSFEDSPLCAFRHKSQ